jgi:4-diphosphocytidyl-2-C-methyl-D-erythritol kinase
MSSDALTIPCPAKINLALSVGPPRAEDGLHPLCSWMVTVGFGDTLTLARSTDGQSSFDIHFADGAPLPQAVDWPLSSDLAFRAHTLMQEHMHQELPVKVQVHKIIPPGAGLGGGSSNAAGMLVGLNELFSLRLNEEELIQLGLRLGSDVGFMVWTKLNTGSAIVSGTGERIRLVPHKKIHLAIVLPPVQCATGEVYRVFDRITQKPDTDEPRVRSLADGWPLDDDTLFNDLSEAAFEAQPPLRKMRNQVQEVAGMAVHLSGSGAGMFLVVPDSHAGHLISERITRETGLPVICTGSL